MMGKMLSSRAEITKVLSKPTWSVSELFNKDSATETVRKESEAPTAELLEKLLKQCALASAKDDPVRQQMLLKELGNQLQFVEHVASVDTTGIEPLVRIGGGTKQKFKYIKDMLENEEKQPVAKETIEGWMPTKLAQATHGGYYVLNEGLRRE
ncbi:hypothetical protein TRVA0_002S00628 [Trichomonascus vanleenenianus]|uniref:glutamyl-tRNA(Gln) amidotransferase subunit F n=1 Tax=Trichomonascus vanleenenianus TaxID=2268995 RepID=UPI003ECA4F25